MDIFSIITLVGGLALFLYGMNVMSDGLEKSGSGKLNKNLSAITKNKFIAMLFGAGLTATVQSSSAVTVMLVGLVNSGILQFGQTIGVLMGSNIGTTMTAWILSLAGIESDVLWLNLLKPVNFAPLFAFIGIILNMTSKKQNVKSAGTVMLGFSVLMFGMTMMSDSMKPLSDTPAFANLLTAFKNPLLAVAAGALFTGVIQSSSASVGVLQAISISGGLTYGMAIPIIMGQNIGTCVTAVISSIGVTRNAKKVALVHLSFNIIGTLICLIPFWAGNAIFDWKFTDNNISPLMIAVVHSIFNIFTTLILLPFTKQLEKIADFIIKDKKEVIQKEVILDDRLLSVPSVAVERAFELTVNMCNLSKLTFLNAISQLESYSESNAQEIYENETGLDKLEDALSTYMMKLSKIGLSEADSRRIAKILHTIDDFERIGDHAVNFTENAKYMNDGNHGFSGKANHEIARITEAVSEILNITAKAFAESDVKAAAAVEPLEQAIDTLILEAKRNHIARLQSGDCAKDLGVAFSNVLTDYERVSDHCSNIAVAVIEAQHGTFATHEYLQTVKGSPDDYFREQYAEYLQRFSL